MYVWSPKRTLSVQNAEIGQHLVTLERVLSEQERLQQSMQSSDDQNSRRMRRWGEGACLPALEIYLFPLNTLTVEKFAYLHEHGALSIHQRLMCLSLAGSWSLFHQALITLVSITVWWPTRGSRISQALSNLRWTLWLQSWTNYDWGPTQRSWSPHWQACRQIPKRPSGGNKARSRNDHRMTSDLNVSIVKSCHLTKCYIFYAWMMAQH